MSEFEKIKLSYFAGIAGPAERIKLCMILKEIPFEDDWVPGKSWNEVKPTTKFGVLPEMRIGSGENELVFGQSEAMLRFVCSLKGTTELLPEDPIERFEIDELIGLAGDLDREWLPCLYIGMKPETFGFPAEKGSDEHKAVVKSLREKFIAETLPKYMAFYEKQLADKKFMFGDNPCMADTVLVPQLYKFTAGFIDYVEPDCLAPFPKILAYIERFRAIPSVKAYYDAVAARKKSS